MLRPVTMDETARLRRREAELEAQIEGLHGTLERISRGYATVLADLRTAERRNSHIIDFAIVATDLEGLVTR